MTQILHVHPVQPQLRLIRHAVEVLQNGGIVVILLILLMLWVVV
jgi:hypothetical protein